MADVLEQAPPTTTPTTSTASPATTGSHAASTSTPADTSKPSRPTSMREAFQRVEANASTSQPHLESRTSKTDITPPAADRGPIPFTVHETALKNARDKAVSEYRQKYGWAERVPQEKLTEWADLANRITTDPIQHALDVIAEIERHPTYGPAWKARQATTGTGHQTAAAMPADVEIFDEAGKPIGKLSDFINTAVTSVIGKEVQPLKHAHEQQEALRRQQRTDAANAAVKADHEKRADAQLSEVKGILDITDDSDPLFQDVLAVWGQHPEWSVHQAALDVRKTKVTPRQQGQATHAAITDMQRKAAGTTVNGTGTTAMPTRPKNREQLRQWMEDHAGGRA